MRRADTSLYYSAPIDNQDNLVCVKFFSKSLKTAKTNVNLVQGRTSSTNTVETHHPGPEGWKKNFGAVRSLVDKDFDRSLLLIHCLKTYIQTIYLFKIREKN